jgi:hypothetical protein
MRGASSANPSFPRSAWERTACDAPRRETDADLGLAGDAEHRGQRVPTQSVGTRIKGRREQR